MASSLRLTTSDNSDTFQKHHAISGGSVHARDDTSASVQCEYLFLELLDIGCDVNQLFGGQADGAPTLTATFIHGCSAGGGGS